MTVLMIAYDGSQNAQQADDKHEQPDRRRDERQTNRTSERQGRMIDFDSSGSMEKKKQEGYF